MTDRSSGEAAIEAFAAAGGSIERADVRALLHTLGASAPALLSLALGDVSLPADVLALDVEAELDQSRMLATLWSGPPSDEARMRKALRRGRHRHLVRLALREVRALADVDTTAREMSALASAATELALRCATLFETDKHGIPLLSSETSGERPAQRVCLGMGKLGGGELNLGSDVDLCFFYETDDTLEVPGQKLSTHEIEGRIATRASKILADVDQDGFVFRVDLRLRPEGARGPVVNSLASAERYYESFGRSWERAVLLRARPIAGDAELGAQLLASVRPFVFRRSVDPKIARDMAQMLERTRRELSVDDVTDVKLGRGGIREAEFFVQTLQLVWGGRHPELQVAGTLEALARLVRLGLSSDREARALSDAWALLRRIEHRVHVWAGYQSHTIPSGPDLEPFARSLSFSSGDALLDSLSQARDAVAHLFRSLLEETARGQSRFVRLADRISAGADVNVLVEELGSLFGPIDEGEAAVHLGRLARHAEDPLGPRARERHPDFGPRLLEEIAESADPGRALRFTADFFARLRGWDYVRLLEERGALRRFVGLFGASDTLASAIVGHPEDLDVLLSSGVPTPDEVRALHGSLDVGADPESFLGSLRATKRQITLRAGLGWASGELDLDSVLAVLSELAIQQVCLSVAHAGAQLAPRFGSPGLAPSGEPASVVVVALGKLGARELGWGSDLDLVFLYDAEGESTGPRVLDHVEYFTRVAQHTLRLLSQADREGPGYATDTRLRPFGAQGTLVSSLPRFARYFGDGEAGSRASEAAGWERQAWVRAVPITGSSAARATAHALLTRAAYEGPPPEAREVASMRRRIEEELAGESEHTVNPKLGRGALLDIEFLTQFLQLTHARKGMHPPELLTRLRSPGTREALSALEGVGALPTDQLSALLEGWRFFRTVEQSLRLVDEAGDGRLHLRSRVADRVARRLGLRDRSGQTALEALRAQFRRHEGRIRGIFERVVAPLDQDRAVDEGLSSRLPAPREAERRSPEHGSEGKGPVDR